MRILFITNWFPYPPNAGHPLRTYNLLSRLGREHEIWVMSFVRSQEETAGAAHLLSFCKGVVTVEAADLGAAAQPLTWLRYVLAGIPPDLRLHMNAEMIRKLRDLVTKVNFDIVDIEDSYMALYREALPRESTAKTLLVFHDVVFRKYARMYRLEPKLGRKIRLWLHSTMMRRWEPRYAERFDHCIAVSELDRQVLTRANPRLKLDVVPNGVDTRLYQLLPFNSDQPVLLFVGNMNYRPNVDAMLYFVESILPLIQRAVPATQLWIVGKDPSAEITGLAGNGITVTGEVEDLQPYYRDAVVCVVPLRAGSGTRLKILEAMALGRPVVSTSLGCEGLAAVDGEHLLIANAADDFAGKVVALLRDQRLRQQIVEAGRRLVVSHYDWDALAQRLAQIYAAVATEGDTHGS